VGHTQIFIDLARRTFGLKEEFAICRSTYEGICPKYIRLSGGVIRPKVFGSLKCPVDAAAAKFTVCDYVELKPVHYGTKHFIGYMGYSNVLNKLVIAEKE